MSLYENIKIEIINGMKEKRLYPEKSAYYNDIIAVFKSVKSRGELIAKEQKTEIGDEVMLKALTKEVKELQQTIASTPESSELHQTSVAQYNAIKPYLPEKISGERLKQGIEEILVQNTFENFGQAMKYVTQVYKNTAEPKEIAQILKELL
ncbi:MAG: GatB/YqeY domain-containing protein [Candidatus Gastranaerophilaceae bacterium]